jgi:hypothetical protein
MGSCLHCCPGKQTADRSCWADASRRAAHHRPLLACMEVLGAGGSGAGSVHAATACGGGVMSPFLLMLALSMF